MFCFTSQATGAFVELSKCLSFFHPGIHHHFDSISVILFSNHQRHKNQRIVLSGSRLAQRRITWITYIGPMDYLHHLLFRKTHSAFLRKTTRLRNFFSLKNSSNRPEKTNEVMALSKVVKKSSNQPISLNSNDGFDWGKNIWPFCLLFEMIHEMIWKMDDNP